MHSASRRSTAADWRGRWAVGGLLLLVYAVPLFWPPTPVPLGTVSGEDAWLLERIIPGVPPLWVGIRLTALFFGAILLSGASVFPLQDPFRPASSVPHRSGISARRALALAVAVLHALSAPWAFRLGPTGQTMYFLMLGVPPLLLAGAGSIPRSWRASRLRRGLPAAVLILLWMGLRLSSDLSSPRVAEIDDMWPVWPLITALIEGNDNLLTNRVGGLPGVGSVLWFFLGIPLFRSGFVPLSFNGVQVFLIFWLATCAVGLGMLARALFGRGAALIAIAVFLFGPYIRFVSLFPTLFLLGPIYSTAVALCALVACRRRSEAALATLGAFTGMALMFPGVVPVVAFFLLLTLWHLRSHWRSLWVGGIVAFALFVAVVLPAAPAVFLPLTDMLAHLRWEGAIEILDAYQLGQLPLRAVLETNGSRKPFDIVVAAVLLPFAHPRIGVRLLGDAIFDPVGAAFLGVGLMTCVRSVRSSPAARLMLLFFVAALSPAFISPINVVDVVHAVALPVPAALLAAAGFTAVLRQLGWRGAWRRRAVVVTTIVISLGGTVLFDVVNPRIISASAIGLMFRVLHVDDAERTVWLNYQGLLDASPIAAVGWKRPVACLPNDGARYGSFSVVDLVATGKDLVFWSPSVEQDLRIADAICTQWPDAVLYEIWDEARLGRAYAARVGGPRWEPQYPASSWTTWDCASRQGSSGASEGSRRDE